VDPETRALIDESIERPAAELRRHMTEVFESIRADVRRTAEYLRLRIETMDQERVERLENRIRMLEQWFEILEESKLREFRRRP
jgi:vacuolar-type H+-ATPase subunit E/Vma4